MVMASNRSLKVETAEDSRAMLLGVLNNQAGPCQGHRDPQRRRGPVRCQCGKNHGKPASHLRETAIESGAAKAKLDALGGPVEPDSRA